jgi:hypothetical protein
MNERLNLLPYLIQQAEAAEHWGFADALRHELRVALDMACNKDFFGFILGL